jgi:putative redox protein
MYARRKSLPLESVGVKVKITSEGNPNRIFREVHLRGDLSEEQKKSLMAIADKCPIHKFLSAASVIETIQN